MVKVTIRGREYPLCLTIAALDKIIEKCGSLNGLSDWLDGDGNFYVSISNTAWLLGVMIEEGEANRLIEARFKEGDKAELKKVPDADSIVHLLTLGETQTYRRAVLNAVSESLNQTIEAEHPKNEENAEQ